MGPLKGIKVLEFSGIGPGPYCGMLLADMGADVIRVNRINDKDKHNKFDIHNRSKRSIVADLKNPYSCLLYTSPSPRDSFRSRMPSSA